VVLVRPSEFGGTPSGVDFTFVVAGGILKALVFRKRHRHIAINEEFHKIEG